MNTFLRQKVSRAIAFVFVVAPVLTHVSLAQDLQVIVSGPWSFVTDPSPNYKGRLLLVAPGQSSHHKVYILPGTDPTTFTSASAKPLSGPGTFRLDYTANKGTMLITDHNTPQVCGGAITSPATNVRPILDNSTSSNYVISLPAPDEFTTFPGSMGTSESEVSGAPIKKKGSAPPLEYTTIMVLHYSVDRIPDQFTIAGSSPVSTNGAGISIVAGDPDYSHDDPTCDHVSLESVKERNDLWALQQYSRLPGVLINSGVQNRGNYNYEKCSDHDPTVHPKGPFAGGSADCHACQISINSAVTGAVILTNIVHK